MVQNELYDSRLGGPNLDLEPVDLCAYYSGTSLQSGVGNRHRILLLLDFDKN